MESNELIETLYREITMLSMRVKETENQLSCHDVLIENLIKSTYNLTGKCPICETNMFISCADCANNSCDIDTQLKCVDFNFYKNFKKALDKSDSKCYICGRAINYEL